MEIVDKLHRERVSQRGMARVTGISRPTIKRWLRNKGPESHRDDDPADRDPSGDRDR
jgi:transcriptional regulator with XRE-family HTH domain